jgi:hypothetical protein
MMSQILALCECGCGTKLPIARFPSEQTRFIFGHVRRGKLGPESGMYGKKHSAQAKSIMRLQKMGENNPIWKGDNVGYKKLHTWVNENWPEAIPEYCEICNKVPWYDLANITGIYNREFENWQFQCRSCHMKFDYKMGFRKWTRNE